MAKIKGFSILSKTNHQGLWLYKHYWEQYKVEVNITTFKEAHEWISDTPLLRKVWIKINDPTFLETLSKTMKDIIEDILEEYEDLTFELLKANISTIMPLTDFDDDLSDRGYIAHWQFEEEDLPMVLIAWMDYRKNFSGKHGYPVNADGVE